MYYPMLKHGIDQHCIRRTPLIVLGTSGGPSWAQALVSPRMPLNKFPRPYAIPKNIIIRSKKMLRWIQGKTKKDRIRNEKFRSDAMVKPITTYVAQKRLSWYGHVMRRDEMNVAKHVTTMKVGDLVEGPD